MRSLDNGRSLAYVNVGTTRPLEPPPADPVETEAYLLARANQHRKPWARRWLRANGYWL